MARTVRQRPAQHRDENDKDSATPQEHQITEEANRAGEDSRSPSGLTSQSTPAVSGIVLPITPRVSLPLELFGAILDELLEDKKILLQFRLLSKNLRAVADSRAFRCLSVWCTGQQGARRKGFFDNVANDSSLSAYVKEIIWKEETGVVDTDALEAFLLSVKALTKFPNVNNLRFWFPSAWNEPYDEDDDDDNSERSPSRNLQIKIIDQLAKLYSSSNEGGRIQRALDLLEIRGLITLPNESLRSDIFKQLVEPIPNLVISLVTNDYEDFNHSNEAYSAFLDIDLTGILNAARNLTSLTLESDIITFYDWAKVETLPNLRHLKLENFVFGYLFSPEEFILRHKPTLRQLDLIKCWLDTETYTHMGGPAKARVWKDIFETFEKELVELVDMVFLPLPGVSADFRTVEKYDGYVWLDTEGGFKNMFQDSPCERGGKDDVCAYESLQQIIQERGGISK